MGVTDTLTGLPLQSGLLGSQNSRLNNWRGSLQLVFGSQGSIPQLKHAYCQAPLKIQRTFVTATGLRQIMLLHTAGGMVAGDVLDYQVTLEPRSRVQLTTASAGKIYANKIGSPTRQQVVLRLGSGSHLEWHPRETIVFDQAQHQQSLRVELDPGAIWMGMELIRWGRTARGERFKSGSWRSETEVWRGSQPLWIDRQQLQGGSPLLDSPNGLASYPVMGSWVMVGQAISSQTLPLLRTLGSGLDPSQEHWGLTQLEMGILARYRGQSTQRARDWMTALASSFTSY